ncbi:uncharacterized protein LOC123562599 [Mercenaria mercenaria]|uniref:uncharacterized protein LOC123562599 n=1 Tax=Mercenaria mercenaria TaxID=6596 RepID=UPI00234E3CD3|nr:uncharacterized protein LOC123562599 [Mercenaria mercenaria]
MLHDKQVCTMFLTIGCVGLDCLNGGTVTTKDGICHCICVSGFSGLKCEYELRESMWPSGPYYLPMPKGGCPETKAQGWKIGYLNFTTERPFTTETFYNNVSNTMTSLFNITFEETNILGPFGLYNLQMNFCFKSGDHTLTKTNRWPNWEIEVFSSNEGCPLEFEKDVFVSSFPPLLMWNADGYIPQVHIRKMSGDNTTEVTFTLCKRIVDDTPVLLHWDMPVLFIKQPFTRCNDNGLQRDYFIYEERYPIDVSGVYTNYSNQSPLAFCFYKPVIVDKNLNTCAGCDLGEYDQSSVLFNTENTIEVKQCISGLLSYFNYVLVTTRDCVVMTWILIDARMSVMVSGVYLSNHQLLTYMSKTTVFIDRFKWGFLNNGAHVCNYDRVRSLSPDDPSDYLKCHRAFEGRYVILLSQWDTIWFYFGHGEDLSPANIVLTILPPGEFDVYGQLHAPCFTELGMQQQTIQNFQITASSYEPGYPPHNARPASGGWCAASTDENPYIQVDLLSITIVDGVSVTNWDERLESTNKNTFDAEIIPYGSRAFKVLFATSLDHMITYGHHVSFNKNKLSCNIVQYINLTRFYFINNFPL